jgi:hypothetical protein
MMPLKASPVGIDIPVQRFQKFLYPSLQAKWNINNDTDYDCHGRAYKNQTTDGYIPEIFQGTDPKKIEYKEVFFDDTKKALSFFLLGDVTKHDTGNSTAPVSLFFMVNVPGLKPSISYRADEEIRNDVERLCQIERFGFVMTEMIVGFDSVFKEFSGWRKIQGVKFRDMHPLHCFRLNFQVLYDINECY